MNCGNIVAGDKDTEAASVVEVTFDDYERYMPHIYASAASDNDALEQEAQQS